MLDLSPVALMLLALAATLVGFSKTAVPGAATVTVAVFAAILPARQSTGTLLVLLILGDLFAVSAYHAHADWGALRDYSASNAKADALGKPFRPPRIMVTANSVAPAVSMGRRSSILSPTSRAMAMQAAAM